MTFELELAWTDYSSSYLSLFVKMAHILNCKVEKASFTSIMIS